MRVPCAAFALVEAQPRDQERRDEERAARRPRSRATPGSTPSAASAWKSPSQFATPASAANMHGAERERAERGDEPERVRRRELVGILHDVGNRRVLRRPPQQREHLDRRTRGRRGPRCCPRTAAREQRRRGRCRTSPSRPCGSTGRRARRRTARARSPGSMRAIITKPTAVAEFDTALRDREDRERARSSRRGSTRTARRTAAGSPGP